ncbi:MAG: hemolysin family protein [Spirochaetales bacterium]|uniref:Hemolysin family protein n=1 Tax=Candidatus Thalassospirochaeta sargassi TaxID=3119039 RepID=A0AAJ1IAK8_9SPIO|nr:hemolysin family protein [Spirochaetales bacterium]
MIVEFTALIILLVLSGCFSATETAFTSLSSPQVRQVSIQKGRRGRLVKKLAENPDRLLTTILLGNNLVNIAASALATNLTIKMFGSNFIGAMTGILTLIILIFAELTPKRIAIALNVQLSLISAWPVWILSTILRPVIFLISGFSSLITRFVIPKETKTISFEALLHMMSAAEEEGLVQNYESEMVKSVFRLNEVSVQAIMTHRTDVFSLNKNMTIEESASLISDSGFSRIPVYDREPENIVGIVLSNDITAHLLKMEGERRLAEIMHEPIFTPANRKLHELFNLLKAEKLNISIILDEYGGLAGIVTREDIIEEILGELYDENEDPGIERIQRTDKSSWRIMGDTSLHQFTDTFEIEMPETEYAETIAGYFLEELDRIPRAGDKISFDKYILEIEETEKNRIISILLSKAEK